MAVDVSGKVTTAPPGGAFLFLMWAVTLAAAVGCLAVLPPWSPTWNLAASTVQFPANFTGQ